MQIAFLTGCLEPGKDGVGDYTRSLAQECVNQGHQCLLIAFNDPYISSLTAEEKSDDQKLSIIRSPKLIENELDTLYVYEYLLNSKFDWISLQFSPYSIQQKGIVYNLSGWIFKVIRNLKFHVMFHELWIGESINSPLKDRLIGAIQRYFVLKFLRKTNPDLIHTSNATYLSTLAHYGVKAKILPMFGSIPLASSTAEGWLFPKLQEAGIKYNESIRDKFFLFGIFGSLYEEWPPEPLFSLLIEIANKYNRKIIILSIGRLGKKGKEYWQFLAQKYCKVITFIEIGEKSPDKVSEFLNSIDFGIATSPYHMLGKSSTVITMLEHGLPIIVNRDDYNLKYSKLNESNELQLIKLDSNFLDNISKNINQKFEKRNRLFKTTNIFIKDLMNGNP